MHPTGVAKIFSVDNQAKYSAIVAVEKLFKFMKEHSRSVGPRMCQWPAEG